MLSEQDHQLISASLDGELESAQDLAFKKRLLQEPELNQQYQSLKAMSQNLKSAFGDIGADPVPTGISTLLEEEPPAEKGNFRFMALAASVAMVGLLSFFGFQSSDEMAPALAKALTTQPSMEMTQLDQTSQFIALQSFRHIDGRICREYMVKGEKSQVHGVACKKTKGWKVESKKQSKPADKNKTEHYVTATGTEDQLIESYLKASIKGAPLNEQDELKMISNNWGQ